MFSQKKKKKQTHQFGYFATITEDLALGNDYIVLHCI